MVVFQNTKIRRTVGGGELFLRKSGFFYRKMLIRRVTNALAQRVLFEYI
jgi:hypothetical protein